MRKGSRYGTMSSKAIRNQTKAEAMGTRVSLPAKEASKASFPPGCRVLCFDQTGFRVGTVKDVQISISLPTGGTFGTYYDVEINGSPKNGSWGKGGAVSHVFTESSLRFTPGCPVEVTADYFGSVFRFAGNGGKIQGTVIGCFEMPPSPHARPVKNTDNFGEKRKYFYSVRVKFKGMDEAVEAHGVPPEHVCITTESGGLALSEITSDYNAEVLDCFSPSQKDSRVLRRPEDIPAAYAISHEDGDFENCAATAYDSENGASMHSYAKPSRGQMMSKGFAGRFPSAEPSIRRLRNLQTDESVSPPNRRNMKKVKSKNRSLTPVSRSPRSLRGNLHSSPSRARIYKIGPGVVRPPSYDTIPTATKTDSYEGTRRGTLERRNADVVEIESGEDTSRDLDEYEQNEFGQQDEATNYLSDDLSDDGASAKDRSLSRYQQKDIHGDMIEEKSSKKIRTKSHLQDEQQQHENHDEEIRDDDPVPHQNSNTNIYSDKQEQDWDNSVYSRGSEGGFENEDNFDPAYDSNNEMDHSSAEQHSQSVMSNSEHHAAVVQRTDEIEEVLSADQYDTIHQPENQDTDSSYQSRKSTREVSNVETRDKWTGGVPHSENQDTDTFLSKRNPHQTSPNEVRETRDKWTGSIPSKDAEQFPFLPKKFGKDVPMTPHKMAYQKFEPYAFLGNNAPAKDLSASSEDMMIEETKVTQVPKQIIGKQAITKEDATIDYSTNPSPVQHNTVQMSTFRHTIGKQNSGIGRVDKSLFESSPSKVPSGPIPPKPTSEGCYLSYVTNNGGSMAIKYSHDVVDGAIGFWYPGPGNSIQGFKFKQNQGRSDIIKNVIGRDFKKKYFSGWCQFVKAARKSDGVVVKWANNGGIEVDLYVFNKESCEIKQLEDGVFCDVSTIDAVACIPAGNPIYNGVRKGEYNKFLNIGQGVGSSIAIGGA